MKKLPQITLAFWIMKIAATTLGETGGDLLAQTLQVGYLTSSLILISLFLVSLVTQLKARKFHPALYWSVILSTSTAGTTMSDFMNRSVGLGYTNGALVLLSCLAAVFVFWKYTGNSFDVASITTFRGELLYWIAILFSNTLGTSLGDFLADDSGLGFGGAALLISAILLLIVLAMRFTTIPRTLLFWIAFVLTRPLGASAGDFFSKPVEKGGLGYGTIGASLILGTILVSMIGYSYWQQRRAADPLTQPIQAISETQAGLTAQRFRQPSKTWSAFTPAPYEEPENSAPLPRGSGIRSGYYDQPMRPSSGWNEPGRVSRREAQWPQTADLRTAGHHRPRKLGRLDRPARRPAFGLSSETGSGRARKEK